LSLVPASLVPYILGMLAKVTTKNQLTLPKRMLDAVGSPSYFQVELDEGRLVLTPAHVGAADAVWRKLDALGLTEADIKEAINWARNRS